MKNRKNNQSMIWYGLRISFWIMIAYFIFSFIYPDLESIGVILLIDIIGLIASVYTFVTSIVHLTIFKQKTFAITALVLSSSLVLSWIVYGAIEGLAGV